MFAQYVAAMLRLLHCRVAAMVLQLIFDTCVTKALYCICFLMNCTPVNCTLAHLFLPGEADVATCILPGNPATKKKLG